ncbi:MAG: hypothetical protein AB7F43_11820 [Bacteriovoracia bacterium]
MHLWGGYNPTLNGGIFLTSGSEFTPGTNSWVSTSTDTAGLLSGRSGHIAVWDGSEVLIWGGIDSSGMLNDGSQFTP